MASVRIAPQATRWTSHRILGKSVQQIVGDATQITCWPDQSVMQVNPDHQPAGGQSAQVVRPLQQHDIGARPGSGNRRGGAGRTAAEATRTSPKSPEHRYLRLGWLFYDAAGATRAALLLTTPSNTSAWNNNRPLGAGSFVLIPRLTQPEIRRIAIRRGRRIVSSGSIGNVCVCVADREWSACSRRPEADSWCQRLQSR